MNNKQVRAAILVIGNEILSGRTQDKNIQFIAKHLSDCGVVLAEVRVVEDIKPAIVNAVNELRNKYDFLFTTGGIGPTHDDITTESIAEAFSVEVELREEAADLIKNQYKEAGVQFRSEALKMAMIPEGAELIKNSVSGAPGFRIDNVFVFAGIPHIMQSMFLGILDQIKTDNKFHSITVTVNVGESAIAAICEKLQAEEVDVQIGSYPFTENKKWATELVIRGNSKNTVTSVANKLKNYLESQQFLYSCKS
jgi:molybdenum cofactor synthesis domain-containing protein